MRAIPTYMTIAMADMLSTFSAHCADRQTLLRLEEMIKDRHKWSQAQKLFEDIRRKTLEAEKRKDQLALAQYAFEEICAKTLYNLTHPSAPFDADSAFWIIPLAVEFGRRLGMSNAADITPLIGMHSTDVSGDFGSLR